MLEYIILGFLMHHEMSGYDLKQAMQKSTSNFFDASFGSIYPALRRLEAKGFINFREVIDGGKYKKLYVIADAGKEDFINWLAQPIEFHGTKLDHLVKVFFLGFLPKEQVKQMLEDFSRKVEAVLKKLRESEPTIQDKADVFQYSTLLYGLHYYQFIIDWCNDLLKGINKSQERG